MFKPYQLVTVQADGYRYNGEVMSYETPDHTAMVRRVPGYPGTLEEQPVSKLSVLEEKPKNRYVHYAIIDGRGGFPVDMLRYDWAVPVNFKLIERNKQYLSGWLDPEVDESFGLNGLWIAHLSDKSKPNWTSARWSSFLWGIKHERSEVFIANNARDRLP